MSGSCTALLTAQTADFEGPPQTLVDLNVGRLITIWAGGNFDGASVEVQVTNIDSPGPGDWLPLRAAFSDSTTETEIVADTTMTFTQPGWRNAQLKASRIRAVLTGAGASTEISVEVL